MNIYLKNIAKKYSSYPALSDFSAVFEDGKITAILGPSGCGKTTLLNIVAGLIAPTSGEIYFGSDKIASSTFSNYNIGYVFQDFSLYPNMTAIENIRFPLYNMKKGKKQSRKERKHEIDNKVRVISEMLRIDDCLDQYPNELSGGQQQRVAIGRALVREPDILLMDEPFANLDKNLAIELRDEIRAIQLRLGITTIFVTHNQNDASAVSDKIILLNRGMVQQIGTATELYRSPKNLFVANFIGEINLIDKKYWELLLPEKKNQLFYSSEINCVAFRPENIRISTSENVFITSFRVISAVDNGFFYTITVCESDLFIKIHSKNHIPVGTNVGLVFEDSAAIRFNNSGEFV